MRSNQCVWYSGRPPGSFDTTSIHFAYDCRRYGALAEEDATIVDYAPSGFRKCCLVEEEIPKFLLEPGKKG